MSDVAAGDSASSCRCRAPAVRPRDSAREPRARRGAILSRWRKLVLRSLESPHDAAAQQHHHCHCLVRIHAVRRAPKFCAYSTCIFIRARLANVRGISSYVFNPPLPLLQLTDDQDLQLEGMRDMPATQEALVAGGKQFVAGYTIGEEIFGVMRFMAVSACFGHLMPPRCFFSLKRRPYLLPLAHGAAERALPAQSRGGDPVCRLVRRFRRHPRGKRDVGARAARRGLRDGLVRKIHQ